MAESSADSSDGGSAAAAVGVARICIDCGTADINCGSVDSVLVATEPPVACATAPACPAVPVALVVCGGGVNGAICAAIAEEPA